MMDEIVNRIATSSLAVFDLEDYYQVGPRMSVDISQWLDEGFLLREKEFRARLKDHDWIQYSNAFVAIHCSTDAILPAWATILVTMHLAPVAKKVVSGKIDEIDSILYAETLKSLDYSEFEGKPVIIKGCSRKPVPENAYVLAAQYLQPVAKSIMYGEACSAVPLFKRK